MEVRMPQRPDPRLADAQARITAALEGFDRINRTLPDGVAGIAPPPTVELAATIDAVVEVLIKKRWFTRDELMLARGDQLAQHLEALLAQAEEAKEEMMAPASRIVVPGR